MQLGEYILTAIIVAVALSAALWYIGMYCVARALVKPTKRIEKNLMVYEVSEKKLDPETFYIPYKEMSRVSRYGNLITARYYESEGSNKILLSLHGHNHCYVSQMKYLKLFLDLGYNVFMPNHRRSGDSEGDTITFGAYEKYDVLDWMDVLREEYPDKSFAVFGESMGGATAVMVASMSKDIKFLIDYCGYADFEGLLAGYVKSKFLRKLILPSFKAVCRYEFDFDPDECSAFEAMSEVKCPTLIMHSKTDKTVAYVNALRLKEANPQAEFHSFEEAMHARSIAVYPEEYKQTVIDFVRRAESVAEDNT